MTDEIAWCAELAVVPGCLEPFGALTQEMVAATRREAGVLSYRRFVSDDGMQVHLYERYADSNAALAHLREFAKHFSARFSAMVQRRRFMVFGQPNDELRSLLNEFGAIYLKPFGDFAYWG